jgi:hypothetical protein
MPKVSWSTFVDRHPVGHLVVASLPDDGPPARSLQSQLGRLVGRLGVSGDYSLAIVRSSGHPEIHAGFETPTDADRLAQTVQAKVTGHYAGWGSQWLFVLDDATSAAIEASLAVEGELDER